jgi:diguanylate cyclase (GGDEF)-like protein
MIVRHDGDELVVEVANEIASAGGEGVGSRLSAVTNRKAGEAGGAPNCRVALFAPFYVGRIQYSVGFLSHQPRPHPFSVLDWSFLETIANLCATRLQQHAQFERLQFQTEHDALTAILNRASFRARGLAAMRTSDCLGLLVLNLDDFRHTNDTLGQQAGDTLLVEVATRLNGLATENETVGRLGGDSFAILIEQCVDRTQIQACADRYLRAFSYPFGTGADEGRVALAASIGIALAPGDADGFEMLLARADSACHAAKDAGRGRSSFFDLTTEEASEATRRLRSDLQAALARNEFVLYFQPHVDLETRRVNGAEALIRWEHPERGLVQPNSFIPFAERHGLAGAIGTWVMHETERASREWRRADPTFHAWFNLSAAEMHDATLVPRMLEHSRDLAGLGVEITEGVAMQNVVETAEVMGALHGAGVRVALDDFGTGYSSLAHLKRLPIDVVKIDRAFITGLPADRFDAAIVNAVITICSNFGFETLAEGIEYEHQAEFLLAAGCSLGQGFLYARPMPASQFEALIGHRLAVATSPC